MRKEKDKGGEQIGRRRPKEEEEEVKQGKEE